MLVLLKEACVEIVADSDDPSRCIVSAPTAGDLRAFLSVDEGELIAAASIEHVPDADYPYRISVPEGWVMVALRRALDALDYATFTDAVEEPDRRDAYVEVWSIVRLFARLRSGRAGRRRVADGFSVQR